MAILSHTLHWHGASGEMSADERSYTAVYRIVSDNALDGPQKVFAYALANLPNPIAKTPYSYGNDSDPQAFCNRISAPKHVDGSATVWEITVSFSTDSTDGGGGTDTGGNPTSNPLDFRPEIQIGFTTVQRPVRLAKYRGGYTGDLAAIIAPGTDITPMSSAFGVFDPPLEKEVAMMRVTVTSNVQIWDVGYAMTFLGRVNSVAMKLKSMIDLGYPDLGIWLTISPRCAKLNDYKMVMKRETAEIDGEQRVIDYITVTAELLVDPDGWRIQVPDMDWHRAAKAGGPDGRGGTISMTDLLDGMPRNEPMRGPGGELVSRKVLLDGSGQPLDDQSPEGAVLLTFEVYEEKPIHIAPGLSVAFESA